MVEYVLNTLKNRHSQVLKAMGFTIGHNDYLKDDAIPTQLPRVLSTPSNIEPPSLIESTSQMESSPCTEVNPCANIEAPSPIESSPCTEGIIKCSIQMSYNKLKK